MPPWPRRAPQDPGRPPPALTGTAPGPHTGGMPVSRPGPLETLGQSCLLALGRRGRDPFSRGNSDGWTPGPHTRGTSSLPVKRGHVGSRHGRSDPVRPKRPLALAREICPTDSYFESFSWRSTCDRLVAHQRQPRSRDFPGTSKSPSGPPVKGLILCKPDLDHLPVLHRAPDAGAPQECHVAPFPRLHSRRCPKLRPYSAETGLMGPEGRVF